MISAELRGPPFEASQAKSSLTPGGRAMINARTRSDTPSRGATITMIGGVALWRFLGVKSSHLT